MNFIGSLKQIILIFYDKGGRQFPFILFISFAGVAIELAGLMLLYLVINSLIQFQNFIQIPLIHSTIEIQSAVILLLTFYLIKFIFSIWQNRYLINFCYKINYKITSKIIEFYYNQPIEATKNNRLAEALNKVFTIGGFFSEIIFQSVLVLFNEVLITSVILTLLLIFNFKLLLLLVVIIVPVSIILLYFSRIKLKTMSNKIMNDNIEYHQSVMTLLMGQIDVKLSGRFGHFFEIFNSKINALHLTRKIVTLENSFPPKVLEFITIAGIAALFFITRYFGNTSYLAGFIAAFATAAFRFIPSLNRIIASIQNLHLYTEYIQFINKIKNTPSVIKELSEDKIYSIHTVELKNISFSYTNSEILKNISLTLISGKLIGITGASGVGKTTLANIISGLMEPHSGKIYLNGETRSRQIKESILHQSAYVMQDPYFFNGSLIDNIVFGYDSPNIEKFNWCIHSVNMNEWMQKQALKHDTIIGESAIKLSGGQKQRLAIARALYRKAKLLILDEPSSSLDNENKQEILELIKQITKMEKLITILVSHDAEVLNYSDTIYQIEDGKLNRIK